MSDGDDPFARARPDDHPSEPRRTSAAGAAAACARRAAAAFLPAAGARVQSLGRAAGRRAAVLAAGRPGRLSQRDAAARPVSTGGGNDAWMVGREVNPYLAAERRAAAADAGARPRRMSRSTW